MLEEDTTENNSAHPYENLTPDCILDALESVGFETTGSLLALNSYENRVYQVSLADGRFVIAKFYRPERWPDKAILEEHALFEKCDTQKKLVFRVWPVFFAYNKRIEFKIYNEPAHVEKIIRRYLELLAKTNDAELVVKM